MTKKFYYTGLDEARRRLENSVILYEKEPYYVASVFYKPKKAPDRPELQEGARTDFGWMVPLDAVRSNDTAALAYLFNHLMHEHTIRRSTNADGVRVYTVLNMDRLVIIVQRYHEALRQQYEMDRGRPVPEEVPPEELWVRLTSISVEDEPVREVSQTDPKLDLTSPRLGMINTKDGSVLFAERTPLRRSAQGLNNNNLNVRPLPGLQRPSTRVELRFWPELAQTIRGEYPPYDEALMSLFGYPGHSARAFSRDFAVSKEDLDLVFLTYRMQKIAWSADGRAYTLNRGMEFAREQLEKLGVQINAAA
jgi:hypothetical protein